MRARLAPPFPIPMTPLFSLFLFRNVFTFPPSPLGRLLLMGHIWGPLGAPCVCLTLGCILLSEVSHSPGWVPGLLGFLPARGAGLPCRPPESR